MKDTTMEDSGSAVWCDGKEAFATASLARKIAKRSSGRHDRAIMAYHCAKCGYWHTGSSGRGFKKMRIVRK